MIATRRPTPEQMAWAKQTLAKPAAKSDKADLPRIYAGRTIAVAESPEAVPVPLQVFRIGPVCIGTMPTEVFCEIGLEFKKRSPIQPALLVSLAHGYLGYLPTPRHFRLGRLRDLDRHQPARAASLRKDARRVAADGGGGQRLRSGRTLQDVAHRGVALP